MSRVSLVLPSTPGAPSPAERAPVFRAALESAGHEVETLVVVGPGSDASMLSIPDAATRVVVAAVPGQAAAAVAGIQEAEGDIILVLDTTMGYRDADLPRLVEPLAEGRAELAVASRLGEGSGSLRTTLGSVARLLVGSSDPFSGLIGMTRVGLGSARQFHAVGSKFSFELLAKFDRRDGARRLDLPIRRDRPTHRTRLGLDDVRHLKRLADHRFGNLSRLFQFCVVGASGMVVDLTLYAAFQWIFARTWMEGQTVPRTDTPLPLAASAVVAVGCAMIWNFTLNRRLTFNDARTGSIWKQFLTYALSNALSVPLSLLLRLWLPSSVSFFHHHRLAAAVVGIVTGTALSFSMSRWLVFRNQPSPSPPPSGRTHLKPSTSRVGHPKTSNSDRLGI